MKTKEQFMFELWMQAKKGGHLAPKFQAMSEEELREEARRYAQKWPAKTESKHRQEQSTSFSIHPIGDGDNDTQRSGRNMLRMEEGVD